jgi:NADPH-dependent curcumin reductase CurA
MISQYNDAAPAPGPTNLSLIMGKRLLLRGFIVRDFGHLQDAFARDLAQWMAAGRIVWKETVQEGIESAPEAFLGLFQGGNLGKMLVRLA